MHIIVKFGYMKPLTKNFIIRFSILLGSILCGIILTPKVFAQNNKQAKADYEKALKAIQKKGNHQRTGIVSFL